MSRTPRRPSGGCASTSATGRESWPGIPASRCCVVHGAPVTDRGAGRVPDLRLVCCARGGPVNVDVDGRAEPGSPLVNTPGKNAESVADQTLAFIVMLARGFPDAQRFLLDGDQLATTSRARSSWVTTSAATTLGLVGYGNVGRRVARARARVRHAVLVYDPYVDRRHGDGVEQVATLDELLARSRLRLAARPRDAGEREPDRRRRRSRAMNAGAFLVNTARETLVDEDALDAALAVGTARRRRRSTSSPDAGRRRTAAAPRERRDHARTSAARRTRRCCGRRDDRRRDPALRSRRSRSQRASTDGALARVSERAAARDRRRHRQLPRGPVRSGGQPGRDAPARVGRTPELPGVPGFAGLRHGRELGR